METSKRNLRRLRRIVRRKRSKTARRQRGHKVVSKHDPDMRTLVIGRSWLADVHLIGFLVVSIAVFLWGTASLSVTVQPIEIDLPQLLGGKSSFGLPLLALPPLVLLIYILHRHFNYEFIIAPDHVIAVKGKASFFLRDTRIDYENVRGVEIDQTLFQRLFNVGDVKVGSSMHSEIELNMRGVRWPNHYRNTIERRIHKHFSRLSHNPDVPQARRHGKTATGD